MSLSPLNGNGSIIAAISKYGVAAVLLAYLVYVMANTLPTLLAKTTEIAVQHEQIRGEFIYLSSKVEERDTNTQKILRGICLILAQSQQDKNLCNP